MLSKDCVGGGIKLEAEWVGSGGRDDGARLGEVLVVNVGKVLGHCHNILHVVKAVGKGPGRNKAMTIVVGE